MGRISYLTLWGTLLIFTGCGGGGSSGSDSNSSATSQTIAGPGLNVQPIVVNAGPAKNYANGVFTSVTVCVPGSTTSCQTIDGVLVDTGSVGLRLLSANDGGELTLTLPQFKNSDGNPVAECTQYGDFSYAWGSVQTADIHISGETASSLPINVLGDPIFSIIPKDCSGSGGPNDDNLENLGANGILGVGNYIQDCGSGCVSSGNGPPSNAVEYYECPTADTCKAAFVSLENQVQNPVASFAIDNNGLIVELPLVPGGSAESLSGALVFGIGTRSNNGLGSVTIFPVDSSGNFANPVLYGSQSYPDSFIDSGSNAIFFNDSSNMPTCPDDNGAFYCPSVTQSFSATNQGENGASNLVQFSVANADELFDSNNSNNFVFTALAGPNSDPQSFDWGLPFFFGRNVYIAIETENTPGGTGPYWAY